MINGFWIVQYDGVVGSGGGVAVFLNGVVYGGDTGYIYQGKINEAAGKVAAHIAVKNFLPGIMSVLGTNQDFDLEIVGELQGNVIQAKASVIGTQVMGIIVKLTRVSDVIL